MAGGLPLVPVNHRPLLRELTSIMTYQELPARDVPATFAGRVDA